VTRIAGSLTDITESAIAREKIIHAGSRDPLTNLLNRTAFIERLDRRLSDYKERQGGRFAALYLDIDRFKVVNDSLGHQVGDELLTAVARRLEACLRPGDAIARFGGDEFAVLLQNISDEMQANVIAFRLQEALQPPFPIGGREVVTSASIGIAISRPEHASAEEVMRDADTAMCHAKTHGKARHELFDADTHARTADRLGLENDLRHAVKSSCFEVHYQPIVSLNSRMTTGFESLVRWNRHGKPVSPADFIPMAEELGIIEPLGTWVMQQACEKFVEWKARYPQTPLDCITVNVSAKQLVQQGFVYLVEQTVEQNGMNPADLRIEITETALMDAPQFVARVLAELREFGVKIYLDDFGTGYSSLSHLHKLPVDALKIDRSFVRGLLLDDRPAIVESILALARTLQTSVVAEGIEEERQAAALERLGCQRAQGFYFSRPIPAEKVEDLLALGRPLGGARIAAPQPARATLLKPVPTREIA
jgi:diguanylate cyclase (GGDEF)-like protein